MTARLQTYTGRVVNPLDLQPDDIDIYDIAHSLACVNRFGGHARRPISVAQHSVHVSTLVPPEHALQGLLHDAAEAYLGDVTKWLKQTEAMAGYRAAEDRAWAVIARAFGVPEELAPEVEAADIFMVRLEATSSYDNWRSGSALHPQVTATERERLVGWEPWCWHDAEARFLATYEGVR